MIRWLCAHFGSLLSAHNVVICGLTERINAPWLPWFRRYLSVYLAGFQLAANLAGRTSVAGWTGAVMLGALYWNIYTAMRNRRGGRRGKPRPTLSAALTAVQAVALRREVRSAA